MTPTETTPVTLKEKGNEAFKQGDLDEALAYYTQAIDLSDKKKDEKDLAVIFKNRAAVHLKNEDYEDVVADCTKSIELVKFNLQTNDQNLFKTFC